MKLTPEKASIIDEIITCERYDLHNQAFTDNPMDEIQEYREQLAKLPIEVLQAYVDEEITSEELYDEYIAKLEDYKIPQKDECGNEYRNEQGSVELIPCSKQEYDEYIAKL